MPFSYLKITSQVKKIFLASVLLSSVLLIRGQSAEPSPILVLATDQGFGSYTGEILRAEGFNLFVSDSVQGNRFSAAFLKTFGTVILAQRNLSRTAQKVLRQYVTEGGKLLAIAPDPSFADMFGIVDDGKRITDGYVQIDTSLQTGRGLTSETLQFHGTARQWKTTGAKTIADMFPGSAGTAGSPAVVMNQSGKGRTIAFLYNLPESIVLTRQGNPASAGKEMDSIPGIRAMDLFTGGWVNTKKNTLNQADEQMHLLGHCLEYLATYSVPLPRLWYFPDSLNCLVTLNNDGEDSEESEFTPQFEDVHAKGAKMTLYIKEPSKVSADWVQEWTAKGFEIAGHPDDTKQASLPDWNTMDSVIRDLKKRLNDKYGIGALQTNTNHWFVWVGNQKQGMQDLSAQAQIEELNGMGLDCNYAHYDNNAAQGHFLGEMGTRQGNYTGSGLTMKYAAPDGRLINVYQQLNNVYDQQYMEHKDQEGYYNAFRGLVDRSLHDGVYSVVSIKAHNNEYYFSKVPLMNMLDYANEHKIPVWTELMYLEFLRAKDETAFKDVSWNNTRLSFTVATSLHHPNAFSFLLPALYRGKSVNKITVDGKPVPHHTRIIKGFSYAMVTVPFGQNYQVEALYK